MKKKSKRMPEVLLTKHYRLERAFNRFLKAQLASEKALLAIVHALDETVEQLWDESIRRAALKGNFQLFRRLSAEKKRRIVGKYSEDLVEYKRERWTPSIGKNDSATLKVEQLA